MNPEFRRNLWLELTPRRVAFMAGVLLLIFLAAALTGGGDSRPAAVAKYIYYFIVVLWGTRTHCTAPFSATLNVLLQTTRTEVGMATVASVPSQDVARSR